MLNESTERVAEVLVLFRTLYVFIEQMYNDQGATCGHDVAATLRLTFCSKHGL